MPDEVEAPRLLEVTNNLIDALTSETFVSRMSEIRNAPESERLERAASLLAVSHLRDVGASLPNDIRISSRYFEQQSPPGGQTIVEAIDKADPDFLERLKTEDPKAHSRLMSLLSGSNDFEAPSGGPVKTLGICAGGGANGVCACAGQPLM